MMSQQSIHNPIPWTPEDDDILIACWPDPDIDFAVMAKLIPGPRTVGAILHRGTKIGLGPKTLHKKAEKQEKKRVTWPDDMPNFEDHPHAAAPGPRVRAAVLGSRFKSFV
jgi:hypothetical protein